MSALAAYEQTYGIPQVDAYTYARPQAGLQVPTSGGYSGGIDGVQAQVTTAGRGGPFGYLKGAVPFEDNSPTVNESYAYLSTPAPGADFTPYVQATIPGTTTQARSSASTGTTAGANWSSPSSTTSTSSSSGCWPAASWTG